MKAVDELGAQNIFQKKEEQRKKRHDRNTGKKIKRKTEDMP